jgi:hypothetical protein
MVLVGQGHVVQEEELCAWFWWGNLKERDTLEVLGGRIILKWILKKEYEGMNWMTPKAL